MGLRVNNNIAAFNSYRNLQATDKALNSSLEKLSSGLRINKAADDAAGLVISEGLRSQIGGLTVAARNAQDGVNVAQTADGALGTATTILQRMRDLAVQSSNDTNDSASRAAVQKEITSLTAELDRISEKSSFNGVNLLDGTFAGKVFQVGYANGDTITFDVKSGAGAAATVAAVTEVFVSGATAFNDTAVGAVSSVTISGTTVSFSTGGTAASAVEAINANATISANWTAALSGSSLVLTSKVAGNVTNAAVTLGTTNIAGTTTEGVRAANAVKLDSFGSGGLGVAAVNLSTQTGAASAITTIDNALKTVSSARAGLGALQNRFESVISSVNIAIENLTASESAIRDTDMAAEMTKFTRSQILSQAGTSMLAQANSASQNVLSLLRG
ncbi:flagellin N-terminal helical domain-containing protein [Kineococcus sp. SYSU DK018]|uniref:flagellin N-terminal helical domain-containing protein n=1 Tax=Kineococcus sp. SYSU DK018 TaxID=3383139 RepID=UPI003D7EDDBE